MNTRTLSFVLVGLLMSSIFVIMMSEESTSYEITEFGNSGTPTERLIVLQGKAGEDAGGMGAPFKDATTYIDLPIGKNVILPSSHLKVSVVDTADGKYAQDPSIDVGMDGDLEWAYTGEGYGDFGRQNVFSDDTSKKTLKYLGAGSNTNLKVKLPIEGDMSGAKFSIEGRLSSPTFNGYKLDIDKGLQNVKYMDTGDINSDGSLDIVATSSNSDNSLPDLVWYENAAPPTDNEWIKHYITNTTNNAFEAVVADVDGDGDQDIVMSTDSQSGGVQWFENKDKSTPGDGDGSQWEFGDSGHRIDNSNKINYARNIDVDDIDNDGDMDVAVTPYEFGVLKVYWFENTNPSSSTTWSRHTAYSASTSGQYNDLVITQINTTGSTRKDIVVANRYGPSYDIFWLENDGTPDNGSWTYHRLNPFSSNYPMWIDAGDINGNGRTDIVAALYYSYGVYWYECPSDPTNASGTWSAHKIGSTNYPSHLKLGKIDNDSDLDLITTTSRASYGFRVHYFECPSTPSNQWTKSNIDTSLSGVCGVGIANLDSAAPDTDNDVFAGGTSAGEIIWYSSSGGASPSFSSKFVDEAGINKPQGLYVTDIDGDGDNDFITTGLGGSEVVWYENPSNPYDNSSWVSHSITTTVTNPWDIAVGYFSNDNYVDVAVTSRNYRWSGGAVYWFQHPGSNVKSVSSWTKRTVGSSLNYPSGIAAGDVDGDGDDDIVCSEEYNYRLRYFGNANGQGTSWASQTMISGLRYYPTGVSLGDLNNDGKLDAVVGCRYKPWWGASTSLVAAIAPANPATTAWTKINVDTDLYTIYDTFIIDIDRDGWNDVIATTSGDGIHWYQNPQGGQTWNEFTIYSDSSFNSRFVWVGDIGADGYYDIIASSNSKNRLYWFEQPDEPEKGYTWESYTFGTMSKPRGVFVEEVDGSGLIDIIAVGYGNSEVWWFSADMQFPHDVSLHVGRKDPADLWHYTYTGTVSTAKETIDLSDEFNTILNDVTTSWETDKYGNNLTEIYLTIYSPDASRVIIHSVNITYTYTARIELNPHNTFLYNELNEIIPDEGSGNYSVNICVQSYTPATLKLSGVFIKYNSPPVLEKEIESSYHVLESKSNSHLINLHDHYSDDYDKPQDLTYRVEYNSRPDKVWALISHNKYVKISATKDDDWFGTFDLQVSATDSLGLKTKSNTFTITVDNDDDSPYIGDLLPDFEIPEGQTTYLADMNRSTYFNDDDSEKLFFRGVVDTTYRQYLTIEFDEDKKMYATAHGDWYEDNVPVQIYADDEDLSDKTYDELENMDVFQDILIDVINVNDAPTWINFPKSVPVVEDYKFTHGTEFRWLNLNDFVSDIDNNEFDWTFSVVKNSNSSFIKVWIDRQDYVHIDNALVENYNGQTDVKISVSDGQASAETTFSILTIPVNDAPTVSVLSPFDRSVVSGDLTILGNAHDLEGLEKVMVKIQKSSESSVEGTWTKATGTTNWKYKWNTFNVEDGDYTLYFRAYDNDKDDPKMSSSAILHLTVYNAQSDPDMDGYFGDNDAFPNEPTQWSDIDDDGYGDNPDGFNPDAFPEDPLEWLDSDGDGYGNRYDDFPYDKTQWNDTDNDGYGDNLWGNNPDTNPNNPNVPGQLEEQTGDKESDERDTFVTYLWNFVIIIAIIVIIISILTGIFYKPPEEIV